MKTLGELRNCPLKFHNYTCQKCKNNFSFLSGNRCSCETTHKFKAKRIIVNEIKFDSFSEGQRYSKLAFLQDKGIISDLKIKTRYNMPPLADKPFCYYEDDFNFIYQKKRVIEDVKGKLTAVFRLKVKMLKYYYPHLELELTEKPKKNKKGKCFKKTKIG